MKHIRTQLLVSVSLVMSFAMGSAQAKLKVDQAFPEIKLKNLKDGKAFNAKSLKGKVVLVDFWASWCGPCALSMPFLQEMAKKYKGKLVVVGVNVDEKKSDAETFLKTTAAPNITFLSDAKQEFVKKVEVATMPSSFLLDKTGKIKVAHEGFVEGDKATIEAEIKKLLK